MRIMLTGASEGIGGATLRRMAARARAEGRPARIAATASGRKSPPEALLADLRELGAEMLYLTGDISDAETARRLAVDALDFCGGMDVFVANAGAGAPARLADQPLPEWDRMFDLNLRSVFVLAQALYPALKAARGNVVAVASMSGLGAHPGQAAYAPAKAALVSLVRNLAVEWAPDGIRVNAIAPGMIRTPLTEKLYEMPGVAEARAARVPLGRVGTPEDIAGIADFLASADAAYVTGQVILADGGLCATALLDLPA